MYAPLYLCNGPIVSAFWGSRLYCKLQKINTVFTLFRVKLPEFYLDFQYVVYGATIPMRSLYLINNGYTPISFSIPHTALEGSGFSIDLMEKVRSLPPGERIDFNITFDPTTIKMTEGKAETSLNFNVSQNDLGWPLSNYVTWLF